MTSPIGKLLLQHTKLPLDVIQYCIEPCFGVTEEEVKENRKKLIMELGWSLLCERLDELSDDYVTSRNVWTMFKPRWRDRWIIRWKMFPSYPMSRKLIDFYRSNMPVPESGHILKWNDYMASLPCMRSVTDFPDDAWDLRRRSEIKVNLKTKTVTMYSYSS